MRLKSVLGILLISISMTSCSLYNKLVYRIDVPQGNYLEQDQIAQLQVGMNHEQVIYLLGAPVLRNSFAPNRWDYVFIKREGHNDPVQHTLQVYFDQRGIVTDIKLDKPLDGNQ